MLEFILTEPGQIRTFQEAKDKVGVSTLGQVQKQQGRLPRKMFLAELKDCLVKQEKKQRDTGSTRLWCQDPKYFLMQKFLSLQFKELFLKTLKEFKRLLMPQMQEFQRAE